MRSSRIAIVGMAGRFPGAENVDQFWQNLRDGVESIRTLSDSELLAAGASPKDLINPHYVKRASMLDGFDLFDASFFGLTPRDASIMDPQHRHFLECAWEALEDAAHAPRAFKGSIGVFAGSGMNSYLIHNLLANRKLLHSAGIFQLKQTGNDKDVLATRVSYHFDLRGPSINVQTACSTSLVAVHLACQSLLNHECDLALAGGVTIEIPHGRGYIYHEGEILSRDGKCRPFDAASTGTVFGSGVGLVVLRRLDDAIEDRDSIRAVIVGSAINNDGARKVGFFAPSVDGHAEVVEEALGLAGITADDISYVEAHGTGTLIGDPIELQALTQAFRKTSARLAYCAIGSVKSNIGHLDAAAGVASLIKTVLALQHRQLPSTLHFESPNPNIDFEQSPFFVNCELRDWLSNGEPRRAGVSSLGIGGTNAHVVLEEAPPHIAREAIGTLSTIGAEIDRRQLPTQGRATRISLPKYSFDHKRFWIDPDDAMNIPTAAESEAVRIHPSISKLAYFRPVWKPSPRPPAAVTQPQCWLVCNDSCGLGNLILAQLAEAKHTAVTLEPGSTYKRLARNRYEVRPGSRADYDLLISSMRVDQVMPEKIVHLWSILPEPADSSLRQVVDGSFFSLLFLVQAVAVHNIASLEIGIVSNSMQRVFDKPVRIPSRAVLLGLSRVIPLELPEMSCRSIDVELTRTQLKLSANHILSEMKSPCEDSVIAYRLGTRFVESVEPFEITRASTGSRVEHGGVYLITGGLGGIGLAIAERLAIEFKAHLVLVTRKSLPLEVDWETCLANNSLNSSDGALLAKLVQIRSAAGSLAVMQADVTDLQQMQTVVDVAIHRYKEIDGVFHAAGILEDGPLLLKDEQSVSRVLNVKVRGTLVLEAVLRHHPLRFFVLLSSISALQPPPGQVDYAAANAFLNAFAESRKGPFVSINWGAWKDIGMTSQVSLATGRLLAHQLLKTSEQILWGSQLSPRFNWLFADHCMQTVNGLKSLFPGAGYLALAAEAFTNTYPRQAILFQDVFFVSPLFCEIDGNQELRVRLRLPSHKSTQQDNEFAFSIHSQGADSPALCTGTIGPYIMPATVQVDLNAIRTRCSNRELQFGQEHRTQQERYLVFGPRWQSLKRLQIGDHEALAEVALREECSADVAALQLHPALLDLATGAAVYLIDNYEQAGSFYLPVSYKKMWVQAPLPATLFSHIRKHETDAPRTEFESFDITVVDSEGRTLIEIEKFTMRRIADLASFVKDPGLRPLSKIAAEDRATEIPDPSGIRPSDGIQALFDILSADTPHSLIAVQQGFEWRTHEPSKHPQVRSNPRVPSAFTPPPKTVEDTLAGWLCELLGLDQVTLDDDFFDLGGHSLVGIRLLTMIKNTYHVELDLPALTQAGTVRNLALLILQKHEPHRFD